MIRKTERDHIATLLETHKCNLRKTWEIVKNVINKKQSSSYPEYFVINGKDVSNNLQIANGFNKYFVNIGPNLSKAIPKSPKSPVSYMNENNPHTIFLKPVVEDEVVNIIKCLKESSAGWDNICPAIVKSTYLSFIKPLTHVLNLSITEGLFPNELKIAKVIPLFKKGDRKIMSNYRPVSVLSTFSKILEKIMYSRLITFINKHNILYPNQFGFRKKHSTSLALSLLVSKITESFEENKITLGVFLDFSKAFDTVDHTILLQKLECYGVRGLALTWMKSYLTNRQQFVCVNGASSAYEEVVCGVPQGSVLGPLLFLLYINDMAQISTKLFSVLFADDSNLFISDSNINDLITTMNNELNGIYLWLNTNKLSLNIDKSNYMIFTQRNISQCNDVFINGQKLERVFSTKFLGVVIDHKLTWKKHIQFVKSKISKSIGILYRGRTFFQSNTLLTLYYSFILPYFTYCIEIWGFTFKTYIGSLQLLQKKIVRIITCSHFYEHTAPLFKKLQLLNISQLAVFNICLFLYKFENNDLPVGFRNMFVRNCDIHNYPTRQSQCFHVPLAKFDSTKRSFKYNAVIVYNKYVQQLDCAQSYATFKKSVKTRILNFGI